MESFPYYAYMIRFWPARRGGVDGCRVSLEGVTDGQRLDFPDLESLFVFLRAQVKEWGITREMYKTETRSTAKERAKRLGES